MKNNEPISKLIKVACFITVIVIVGLVSFLTSKQKESSELISKLDQFKNKPAINVNDFNDEDISKEDKDSIKKIIDQEIKKKHINNIDRKDTEGLSLFHQAVIEDCESCIDRLLEMGADFKILSPSGASVLNMAISNGNEKLTKKFLNLGLDPNQISNKANYTMLMDASFESNFLVAKLLIDHDADLNTLDSDGMSALAYAAKAGSVEIVEYLLKSGANRSFVDNRGLTAYDHAKRYEHKEIVKILSK